MPPPDFVDDIPRTISGGRAPVAAAAPVEPAGAAKHAFIMPSPNEIDRLKAKELKTAIKTCGGKTWSTGVNAKKQSRKTMLIQLCKTESIRVIVANSGLQERLAAGTGQKAAGNALVAKLRAAFLTLPKDPTEARLEVCSMLAGQGPVATVEYDLGKAAADYCIANKLYVKAVAKNASEVGMRGFDAHCFVRVLHTMFCEEARVFRNQVMKGKTKDQLDSSKSGAYTAPWEGITQIYNNNEKTFEHPNTCSVECADLDPNNESTKVKRNEGKCQVQTPPLGSPFSVRSTTPSLCSTRGIISHLVVSRTYPSLYPPSSHSHLEEGLLTYEDELHRGVQQLVGVGADGLFGQEGQGELL